MNREKIDWKKILKQRKNRGKIRIFGVCFFFCLNNAKPTRGLLFRGRVDAKNRPRRRVPNLFHIETEWQREKISKRAQTSVRVFSSFIVVFFSPLFHSLPPTHSIQFFIYFFHIFPYPPPCTARSKNVRPYRGNVKPAPAPPRKDCRDSTPLVVVRRRRARRRWRRCTKNDDPKRQHRHPPPSSQLCVQPRGG